MKGIEYSFLKTEKIVLNNEMENVVEMSCTCINGWIRYTLFIILKKSH